MARVVVVPFLFTSQRSDDVDLYRMPLDHLRGHDRGHRIVLVALRHLSSSGLGDRRQQHVP